ncbi:hypothetical protein V2J09_003869 [Rumex salicifolius]
MEKLAVKDVCRQLSLKGMMYSYGIEDSEEVQHEGTQNLAAEQEIPILEAVDEQNISPATGVSSASETMDSDDLMYISNSEALMTEFKRSMKAVFEMSDLGRMKYFLDVEVTQGKAGVFICQKKYTRELLLKFGLMECNPVRSPIVPGEQLTAQGDGVSVDSTEYKQLIGSLLYLTATRPDVMFVVCLLSRFMSKPTRMHMQAAKRVLRYLKGTQEFGILYRKQEKGQDLIAYTDSDYARDLDDRRSTSGYVFFLASGAIAWSSKKQPVVSLSTTKSEFIAAASCAAQCIWLRNILEEMGWNESVNKATVILCDNISTIKLSRNPVFHGRSKHIDVRFHFLRDLVNGGAIEMKHCGTSFQIADIMTKAVKLDTFERLGVGARLENTDASASG